MACILLWSSAVRVHYSQACRKMNVTRECISRNLKLREILLSFKTGFNFVNAAVVCAILESTSGLEPSSVITEPSYLKLVTVSSFCPFTLISCWCRWCCSSSAWSSRHWSPCRRLCPRMEAGDVWCLPPVWNIRAVIWFHFASSSLVLLPSPVTLSVLSFSACWPFLLNFFQKILQSFSLRDRHFSMAPV